RGAAGAAARNFRFRRAFRSAGAFGLEAPLERPTGQEGGAPRLETARRGPVASFDRITIESPARMTAPPSSSIIDTLSPRRTRPQTTPPTGISRVKGIT